MASDQTPDDLLQRPRQPAQDRFAAKLAQFAEIEVTLEKTKFDSLVIVYAITGSVTIISIVTLAVIKAHWAQSLLLLLAELVVCGFVREHDVRHKAQRGQ